MGSVPTAPVQHRAAIGIYIRPWSRFAPLRDQLQPKTETVVFGHVDGSPQDCWNAAEVIFALHAIALVEPGVTSTTHEEFTRRGMDVPHTTIVDEWISLTGLKAIHDEMTAIKEALERRSGKDWELMLMQARDNLNGEFPPVLFTYADLAGRLNRLLPRARLVLEDIADRKLFRMLVFSLELYFRKVPRVARLMAAVAALPVLHNALRPERILPREYVFFIEYPGLRAPDLRFEFAPRHGESIEAALARFEVERQEYVRNLSSAQPPKRGYTRKPGLIHRNVTWWYYFHVYGMSYRSLARLYAKTNERNPNERDDRPTIKAALKSVDSLLARFTPAPEFDHPPLEKLFPPR